MLVVQQGFMVVLKEWLVGKMVQVRCLVEPDWKIGRDVVPLAGSDESVQLAGINVDVSFVEGVVVE